MYEIVRYTPALKERVVRLQRELWSADLDVNAAYLEWKYERNPYADSPAIYLALHDGEPVGMRGLFGARWEVGRPPRAFAGPCAGDLVIAPEHRNRGLSERIMDAAARDIVDAPYPFVFNLSASLATQLASLRTGWKSAGPLETARWHAPERWAEARVMRYAGRLPYLWRFAARAARPFHALDRHGRRHRGGRHRQVILERAPRPDPMSTLVAEVGGDGRIRHVRDRRYFEWRFQNPLSAYRFLYWMSGELEGYLVLQAPAHRPGGLVTIVDWEARDTRVLAELLEAALGWGRFDDLIVWTSTLPAEGHALLFDSGFVAVATTESIGQAFRTKAVRPTVLVRAVRPGVAPARDWQVDGRPVLDLASWDLRMVYSDSF
jgi:GNAT superfamily N-acetyltransferase